MRPSAWIVSCLIVFALPGFCTVHAAEPNTPPAKEYEAVAAALEKMIQREMADKGMPALSIALVDDQKIVWAHGYGFADPATKKPATAETVYRVGSVSKLFTDLAVMQLVERGTLDLDAPVTKYLPEFKPINRFDKPITLRHADVAPLRPVSRAAGRQLLRSAMSRRWRRRCRASTGPNWSTSRRRRPNTATPASPRSASCWRRRRRQPFATLSVQHAARSIGDEAQQLRARPANYRRNWPKAMMWTYHGREFPAPTFELGMAPAGCMYTTVNDLGRFLSVLFARGKGPNGAILKPETLEADVETAVRQSQGEKTGFGLGFNVAGVRGPAAASATAAPSMVSRRSWRRCPTTSSASSSCRRCDVRQRRDDAHRRRGPAANAGRQAEASRCRSIETTKLEPGAGHANWPAATRRGDKVLDLTECDGQLYVPAGAAAVSAPNCGRWATTDRRRSPWLTAERIEVKDGKLHRRRGRLRARRRRRSREPMPAKWAGPDRRIRLGP